MARPAFPSENLDERQREITHYGILSYLRSAGALDIQVSVFGRYSSLYFTPGANVGDILYNGIAQTAYKRDVAYGVQAEGAWHASDAHTIRFGVLYQADDMVSRTSSQVLPTAAGGAGNPNPNPLCTDPAQTCQIRPMPLTIADNGSKHGWNYGVYVQDEWNIDRRVTLNYGLRYDAFTAFDAENQLSPRVNMVWKPTDTTTVHAGYARYFSPPPFEMVANTDIALFDNTTAAAAAPNDTPKAERADYYDIGMEQKCRDWTSRAGQFLQGVQQSDRRRPVRRADHPDPVQLCERAAIWRRTDRQLQSGHFSAYVNASYERAVGRDIDLQRVPVRSRRPGLYRRQLYPAGPPADRRCRRRVL